jgi:transposase
MEATGGYERKLVSFLQSKEIGVAVVNAKRVRDYAKPWWPMPKMTALMHTRVGTMPSPRSLKTD